MITFLPLRPGLTGWSRHALTVGLLLAWGGACGSLSLQAQTNAMPVPAVTTTDREQATLAKHLKPILTALNLKDGVQLNQVQTVLAAHLQALSAWHEQNDTQIKALWNEFNKARGKQDQTNADAALVKLDGVYASLQPEHVRFISGLSAVLTPDQIEAVKDSLTINKVKITFHAYGEIFPGLTEAQNAFILKNVKLAREEAIDAGSMPEKSAFFKKYKIRIEAYLTAQGYDVKKAYQVFVAKQKAEKTAKLPAGAPPEAAQ